MNSWSRDGGFYCSPVAKSLLVLTGASSLFNYILSVRSHYSSVLIAVRVWALPSPGTWLMAAMLVYYSRVLERREGSGKFFSYLFLSSVVGTCATSLLVATSNMRWAQFAGMQGSLVHILVGSLLVKYLLTLVPTHSVSLAGVKISGNLPFYLLLALFSCTSVRPALLTFCGIVGGLVIHSTGLSLPRPPEWVGPVLSRLIGRDTPPKLYSGASLQVQRQQRMDDVERMFNQMHQQRQGMRHVRIGNPVQVQPAQPPNDQIEQLMGMGFSREDSVRALLHTGSDVQAAVQLLTTTRHH